MVPLRHEDEIAGYVTASRAAAMLGVKSPYISQLIEENQLDGVALHADTKKESKASVVLVSLASITRYLDTHPDRKRRGPLPGSGGRKPKPSI